MHPHAHRLLLAAALITAVVLAIVLVFADTAGAATRGGRGVGFGRGGAGMHGMGMLPGLGLGILDAAEKLNLKDDQVARLKEIRKNAPGQLMPKAQALMEARIEMQDLMRQDDADAEALRRAHQRVQEARSAMQAAAFDLRLQVREVLTAKQRNELKQMLRERQRERGAPGQQRRFGMQRMPGRDWDAEDDVEF
jgi:Spy/CpxP family protein refolding chaperone